MDNTIKDKQQEGDKNLNLEKLRKITQQKMDKVRTFLWSIYAYLNGNYLPVD